MARTGCIILAAGKGTRMKSARPKVMHRLAGRSLLGHVLKAAAALDAARCAVVAGPGMDDVAAEARAHLSEARVFTQERRLGTADAVSAARPGFKDFDGVILILYGDVPLIEPDSLRPLVEAAADGSTIAVLGFRAADPAGYGRLITAADGSLAAIREHLDASDRERRIDLCNSGIMAVPSAHLWRLLAGIGKDNAKGEYYLTDVVGLAAREGLRAVVRECPEDQVAGVNDRVQLAALEARLQQRLRRQAMLGGATLVDPDSVHLSADTTIGRDVVIEPNVVIGPGVAIGDGATILGFCHIEGARIGPGATVGPFARLRPATELGAGAKVGNFVEIKKAAIAEGAKVNHLSYIGDARVGAGANVGAGTITCNYDGFGKHLTEIGAGAFIGSNSALVAPVRIGEGAYVGSGSVITDDVPDDALALARGRQEVREGWAARYRRLKGGGNKAKN